MITDKLPFWNCNIICTVFTLTPATLGMTGLENVNVEREEEMTTGLKVCYSKTNQVGFEVFTAASMKMAVFWVVVPCSLVEVY
jgi:hypothetical protein